MILPLRRAHRLFALVLAVLLPILVLLSLALRSDPDIATLWTDPLWADPAESRR